MIVGETLMKNPLMAKIITVACGISIVFSAHAGLSLSDAPMFVTETLAPNVIISPVYKNDYNEVSLKDVPVADYVVCSGFPIKDISCPDTLPEDAKKVLESPSWFWVWNYEYNQYGMRVMPWPGACVTPGASDSCKSGSTGKLYSNITVYPSDKITSPGEVIDPLYYENYSGVEMNQTRETVYPEAGAPYVGDANKGMLRYFRSDKNFLYFNKPVVDPPLYEAWPPLGGYTFPSYTVASAANPYYNPLKPQHSVAGDMQASLDSPGVNWTYANRVDNNVGTVVQLPNNVGQYWVHNTGDVHGAGAVWKSTSYDGYTWATMPDDATRINFAHWFTYWRSSYLATRGILAKLIDELGPGKKDLLGRFRVGLSYNGSIGYSGGTGVKVGTSTEIINALAPVIYNFNTSFANWNHNNTIKADPAIVSALNYFGTPAAYRDDPSVADSPIRSCRRSYEIILTPDYTALRRDGATNIGSVGNQDLSMGAPYADDLLDQWADVGAYGWKTDLMPDLANTLLPGKRDPATWQHVVRYVIGPRASGNIFPDSVADFSAAEAIFNAQTALTWENSLDPLSGITTRQYSIDDLWHMVLNSRGFFYTSDNVQDTVGKLLDAFNDVLVRNVSGSAVATNASSLQLGGRVYRATVETDWKGHLLAYNITPVTNEVGKTVLTLDYGTPAWDLAEKVSARDWDTGRNILTYNGGGVSFRWANIGTAAQNLLTLNKPAGMTVAADIATYGENILNYLRGDKTCEDGATTTCTSGVAYTFRRRNLDRSNPSPYSAANPNGRNVLGDIANSSPWYTSAPTAGLSDVDYPGYNQHRGSHSSRGNVLYVGSNDGMLHAVDAGTTSNAGSELFAYMPSFVHYTEPTAGVIPCSDARNHGLQCLADPTYSHKFYADGSPFSAEANLGAAGWKTVLAGGANKGGKGYYLLDVTNPAAITEATAANVVLWEFTHPTDLHYTFNLPVATPTNGQARQIARMNGDKWALIVGNGYPEDSGKTACLFIIYLSGPTGASKTWIENTDYRKLCAGATTYAAGGGLDTNGLSTPTPVDLNNDGNVDVIYAGDLNGNMWRFNVADPVAANWTVDYSGNPLFVAKNAAGVRQPIIAPPEVMPHTVGSASGYLLLFGTGKFIEGTDRTNADVQTFYGVWDRGSVGFSNLTREILVSQVLDTPVILGDLTYRAQSNRVVPHYCVSSSLTNGLCGGDHLGWYWDMPVSGERLTGRVNLISGTVFFNTFYPASSGGALDPCQYGGDGWLMGLNAVNGYMENQFPVFDLNQDGVLDASDSSAAGIKIGAALGGTTFARGLGEGKIGIYSPTNLGTAASEGRKMTTPVNVPPGTTGRVSWIELLD